jgi:hypothetical protein
MLAMTFVGFSEYAMTWFVAKNGSFPSNFFAVPDAALPAPASRDEAEEVVPLRAAVR